MLLTISGLVSFYVEVCGVSDREDVYRTRFRLQRYVQLYSINYYVHMNVYLSISRRGGGGGAVTTHIFDKSSRVV